LAESKLAHAENAASRNLLSASRSAARSRGTVNQVRKFNAMMLVLSSSLFFCRRNLAPPRQRGNLCFRCRWRLLGAAPGTATPMPMDIPRGPLGPPRRGLEHQPRRRGLGLYSPARTRALAQTLMPSAFARVRGLAHDFRTRAPLRSPCPIGICASARVRFLRESRNSRTHALAHPKNRPKPLQCDGFCLVTQIHVCASRFCACKTVALQRLT
jgi:hypothetical protein